LGLCLILAAASAPSFGTTVWGWFMVVVYILMVVVGLGMIIFVHELGHFVVAKLCGVKCLKFYLGFDIFGAKLWKRRWGETEYGIGALPLGGYVKMLGQEDNPARLREELKRAKARQAGDGGQGTGDGGRGTTDVSPGGHAGSQAEEDGEETIDIAAAEQALNDPRSYLCQSVPRRMAIISAGVIMNVIFAFVVAVIAFEVGVKQQPCEVGGVFPGEAAWKAGIRVGDRILMVAGEKVYQFNDLVRLIVLGDVQTGIPLLIDRPGVGQISIRLTTDRIGQVPTIGIASQSIPVLVDRGALVPGSAATRATPEFQGGDRIVEIGDVPIRDYPDFTRQLALHQDDPLRVTVERPASKTGPPEAGTDSPAAEQVVITLPPSPQRRLGLVMHMGRVTAVQDGSPAAQKGVLAGDLLRRIDGQDAGDPFTLPDRVYRLSKRLHSVDLVVVRDGKEVAIPGIPLRPSDRLDTALVAEGSPMALPPLGIAYQVSNTVQAVTAGLPAAAARLKPGDVLVHAKILPPEGKLPDNVSQRERELKLDGDKHNIPAMFDFLQQALPGSRVELTLDNGRKVTLATVDVQGWFYPERGFFNSFKSKTFIRRADSFAMAIELGGRETQESLTSVFQFLRKIGTQVPLTAMGGPISIAGMAYAYASRGIGAFLLFLTFISANLAVVNFLPIPVLDGGHMVFLAYEGIRGKPPSEKIQVGLTYAGLLFLVGLMIFVFGLDLHLIPRG
jgi:regulator of sigma E protease